MVLITPQGVIYSLSTSSIASLFIGILSIISGLIIDLFLESDIFPVDIKVALTACKLQIESIFLVSHVSVAFWELNS